MTASMNKQLGSVLYQDVDSDELKKKRAEVSHAKKGDCNSSCYEGCEACFLDLLILEVFFSKT